MGNIKGYCHTEVVERKGNVLTIGVADSFCTLFLGRKEIPKQYKLAKTKAMPYFGSEMRPYCTDRTGIYHSIAYVAMLHPLGMIRAGKDDPYCLNGPARLVRLVAKWLDRNKHGLEAP